MPGESTLSPPAPLDLGRMEEEAKASATKRIASILQRPEQLERVDQYKRRMTRKKASVDTMLKSAVQSQLDGVRTGLNQLQSALQDVYEIKQSLDVVEETYKSIQPLKDKLSAVNKENNSFCQLGSAMENLKHIFTVPESVRKTAEFINESKLLQAHKHLTDLEMARDDLMFELHKQPQKSPTDNNTLTKYFKDVEKLSEDLGKQLWIIMGRVLITVRREPTLIVTALRIIEREEKRDEIVMKRKEQTGFLPVGRPKRWKQKTFEILERTITYKIEGNQMEDRDTNKMWLVRHLEITRQLMIDDLRVVKTMLPPVFPPSYAIVDKYVKMYHAGIANHITDMIAQGLEGNEYVTLLSWINAYNSPELLKHPDLNIDIKDLGPLLEPNVIDDLQNQYLKNMRSNIMDWTKNSLVQDKKDWFREEHPDADGDGFYSTSLPVILFQMMEQNLQVAQMIGEDLVKKVLGLFADELNMFAKEYQSEIQSYKERHLMDRSEPKFFIHYLIANINNTIAFCDYMKELRKRYLKEEFDDRLEEEEDNIRKDRFQLLTDRFKQIGNLGCNILLDEVWIDLRNSKCIDELLTKSWCQGSHCVDIIYATWADYSGDFVHLKEPFSVGLVVEARRRLLREYIKAILSKKLQLKNYSERKPVADKICSEADKLKELFKEYGNLKAGETDFGPLKLLAEVWKLRDTSMMQLEITGLTVKHPDIRTEQLISLLMGRGDMSRVEARQMVQDTVGEDDQLKPKPKGIFTEVAQMS
ncbi:exocyst complex component 3-like [Ylistrum balloti]|uniref:exocyst complex component 3-like n=1 Tax=Ylistrum balloti TaxID=509963 RepID=UPI002905D1F8|nr:exocyst complex component 3-like [Ylistrum balloti]